MLKDPIFIPDELAEPIRATAPGDPVMLMLDDLGDLHEHVAAEANRTKDQKVRQRLDAISEKILSLLDIDDDVLEETASPATIPFPAQFVEDHPEPLVEPFPTKSEKGEVQYGVRLTEKQRESILHCTELSKGSGTRSGRLPEGFRPSGSRKMNSTNSPARLISPSWSLKPRTSNDSLPSMPIWMFSRTLSIWRNRTKPSGISPREPARSTSSRSRSKAAILPSGGGFRCRTSRSGSFTM